MQEAGMKHRCESSEDKLCMCVFTWFCWWAPLNSFKNNLNLAWLRMQIHPTSVHVSMAALWPPVLQQDLKIKQYKKPCHTEGGSCWSEVRCGADWGKIQRSLDFACRPVLISDFLLLVVKFALNWLTIIVLFQGAPLFGEVLCLFTPHLLLTSFSSICFLILLSQSRGGLVSPWNTVFPPDLRLVLCRNTLPSISGCSSQEAWFSVPLVSLY